MMTNGHNKQVGGKDVEKLKVELSYKTIFQALKISQTTV